ncbi:Baseplate J family protein [Shewanella baltica OS195]|uniref:Baseplate J family protein n=1 Tax=Shewanella baltica (strain OS195) TaxID=399599 RepID=A9KUP8_SHEB9|nr:baseplate J/gp47 family protein [Shewanella baltica]ABX50066.1 Baseplate J family protein [Shewanella baltica OS195]
MAELIDLSKVPVPDIIQPLSFEQRFAALKQLLIDIDESYQAVVALESDPITKLLQVFAYREMHLVAQINDATRGNILASSTGNNLIALGSRYDLAPLVIQASDDSSVPPIPEILEDEQSFKRRVQMAFDGLNTAGSIDGYIFFALGADGRVADAKAVSPDPCEMVVTVLSIDGNGSASDELLSKVRVVFGLSADGLSQSSTPSKVRPQGDRVTIQGSGIVNYSVQAVLQLLPGPDAQVVLAAANQALALYQKEQRRLGADITRSGIFKSLHQSGVNNVNLISPSADVTVLDHQAAYCTSVNISIGGVGE